MYGSNPIISMSILASKTVYTNPGSVGSIGQVSNGERSIVVHVIALPSLSRYYIVASASLHPVTGSGPVLGTLDVSIDGAVTQQLFAITFHVRKILV